MKSDFGQLLQKFSAFLKKHFSRDHEDLPYYLLVFVALVVCIVGINLFVELTDEILENSVQVVDTQITDYVLSYRSPAMTDFFKIITDLGDFYAYLITTILVTIYLFTKFRHWKFILQLVGIAVLSFLANLVLKRFVDRARPGIEHLVSVETLSYPSGHAMSAMAFYGFLAYLTFQIKMSKWLRYLLCFIFFLLIFLIGLSRIYLGVHFPTDVAGGFIAGLIWLAFCIVLFNVASLYRRKKARQQPSEKEENLE